MTGTGTDGLFGLTDRVVWTLTARGVVRQQQGMVTQVVPAGERPVSMKRGLVRDHESYAVTANGVLYWPPVDALALAPAPLRETPPDAAVRRAAELAAGIDGADLP